MTAVPRLQLLPPPGSAPGATAVATTEQGDPRVQPVVPAKSIRQDRQDFQQPLLEAPFEKRQARQELAGEGRAARARLSQEGGPERGQGGAGRTTPPSAPASGRQIHFSRLTSMSFMVQVLGQQTVGGRDPAVTPQTSLTGHRDAALLGSDIYRKAGGEPEILPDDATFVRLAV